MKMLSVNCAEIVSDYLRKSRNILGVFNSRKELEIYVDKRCKIENEMK